ncbi:hypothetical protein EMMF5_001372 [Cystobasidiomycetes sp. EMM_F5]
MTAPFVLPVDGVASDEVPVSASLLAVLSQFSEHVSTIFDDLSRPSYAGTGLAATNQPSAKAASSSAAPSTISSLRALGQLDERLAILLDKAGQHVRNQRRIEQLEAQLEVYEKEWASEVIQLENNRVLLEKLLTQGAKEREAIQQAEKAQLTPSTILSYARLLAPFTSAPPRSILPEGNQAASLADLGPGAILPYPTEEVMRRGRLAFAEVGEIGETTAAAGAPPAPAIAITGEQAAASGPSSDIKPVHQTSTTRKSLASVARYLEEEDFSTFDLDLNPGMVKYKVLFSQI